MLFSYSEISEKKKMLIQWIPLKREAMTQGT